MSNLPRNLDVLALGNRFAPAYRSVEQVIKELGVVTYRDEFSYRNATEVMNYIRNSRHELVCMPNPYGNQRRLAVYRELLKHEFPLIVFDRGGLPGSWFFDTAFNADSRSYSPVFWDVDLPDEEMKQARDYVLSLRSGADALEVQGDRLSGERLRVKYGLQGKRVLFVPFQRPDDTTVKYFADRIGGMLGFCKMLDRLQMRLSDGMTEWVIVGKKHPLEFERPPTNIKFVDDDTHIDSLLEMSDAVLAINSGVGLLAAVWDKPALLAGETYYSHEAFNRAVKNELDVEYWLKNLFEIDSTKRDKFVHHLRKNVYSFGEFETQLVAAGKNAMRRVTTHIDFESVNYFNPSLRPKNKKKRILFVTPVIPWPVNRGNAHRTDLALRTLINDGHFVDLLIFNRSEKESSADDIAERMTQRYGEIRVFVRNHPGFWRPKKRSAKIRRLAERVLAKIEQRLGRANDINNFDECSFDLMRSIRRLARRNNYDFIYYNYLKVSPRFIRFGTPVVCDLHDFQSKRIENDILPRLPENQRRRYIKSFRRSELRALKAVDLPIAISKNEQEELSAALDGRKEIHLLPASCAEQFVPPVKHRDISFDLVFVGSNSEGNRTGLVWFFDNVWPLIKEQEPSCTLKIVGRVSVNSDVRKARSNLPDGVRSFTYIPNAAEMYYDAKVVICPLVKGTGMKIKLVEAMSFGMPIVATSVALEGTAMDVEGEAFDTPEAFATECLRCLSDEEYLDRRADLAKARFSATHTEDHYAERLRAITDLALARR